MLRFETLARACALLAALGALRIGWFHFLREPLRELPAAHAARIDDRYRSLSKVLPARGRFVYLGDEPLESDPGAARYGQALYSLAPRVLVKDDGAAKLGVADLRDPSRLGEVCRAAGFVPVRDFDGGVALVQRAAR